MSLVICDARVREINKPTKFDSDVTMVLRKDIKDGKLVKTYTPQSLKEKRRGERKELWIKYQETPGGKFKEKTFQESTSAHRSISVNIQGSLEQEVKQEAQEQD